MILCFPVFLYGVPYINESFAAASYSDMFRKGKGKAIPVTGRGGP
jgi:hypothetical protein